VTVSRSEAVTKSKDPDVACTNMNSKGSFHHAASAG
jgi:hypothetical protein